jgi:hypothetical protein
LSWTSSNITSLIIDQGIGAVTPVSSGSTTTAPINAQSITYTATGSGPNGTVTCSAVVSVSTGGGGCTSNCGGGGGPVFPNVILSALPHATTQPLAYLYLSQIPYTGLDLGFWGTILYWIVLVSWSLAAAYLVLFGVLPYLVRKGKEFGGKVSDALNATPSLAYAVTPVANVERAQAQPSPYMRVAAKQPVLAARANESQMRYSAYDGFKSFATKEALSIEDIVKGLTRSAPKRAAQVEPVYENVEPIAENVEPIYDNVEPIYDRVDAIEDAPVAPARPAMLKPVAKKAPNTAPAIAAEVPSFIAALIAGDRETVFATLRGLVQSGADSEAFIAQVALALDDAYRARTEGAPVHPEIKRLTDGLATPVLERLVSSLTSAVDSTYSVGITGAKLALTRALSTLGA